LSGRIEALLLLVLSGLVVGEHGWVSWEAGRESGSEVGREGGSCVRGGLRLVRIRCRSGDGVWRKKRSGREQRTDSTHASWKEAYKDWAFGRWIGHKPAFVQKELRSWTEEACRC
jgi:hypothetical protein